LTHQTNLTATTTNGTTTTKHHNDFLDLEKIKKEKIKTLDKYFRNNLDYDKNMYHKTRDEEENENHLRNGIIISNKICKDHWGSIKVCCIAVAAVAATGKTLLFIESKFFAVNSIRGRYFCRNFLISTSLGKR
jgi:hypothetical protein